MKNKDFLYSLIATFFFSGKSKVAPGTMGSLATLPLVALVYPLGGCALFIATLISYLIGIKATKHILATSTNKDPGFVVIDETAGQLTTFLFIVSFYCVRKAVSVLILVILNSERKIRYYAAFFILNGFYV